MSRDDEAERGRAEPIDVEFEPAHRGGRPGGGIGGGTALLLAALAAGVGAAGGAVAPRFPAVQTALNSVAPAPDLTASPDAASAAAIEHRLTAIEDLLNTPLSHAAEAGDAGTASRVIALQAGLRDVQGQLEQMPSTAQVTALVAEVRRLQEELPAVAAEAHAAATAARASYAVVAASDASRSSGPFEQAYASLAALLPDDDNVAALAPLARTGAPTRVELRDRFAHLDNEIIRASQRSRAGAGFWGRIQAALAQWIVVRRASTGDTPEGIVARADEALAGDRLDLAIQELNKLSGEAKHTAQPWINDAGRRLEIDTRLATIRTELARGS